jgi:hypothetical protein
MTASKIADPVESAIRAAVVDGDTEGAIKIALANAYTGWAVTIAADAARAAAKKVRTKRPTDGALADAELAANLLHTARDLPMHVPSRLPGCPRVPGPDDLLAKFADVLHRNTEGTAS